MDNDGDFALALQLQEQFDQELRRTDDVVLLESPASKNSFLASAASSRKTPRKDNQKENAGVNQPISVVDESWELVDPSPNVHGLFLQFNDAFFWGTLDGVEVRWSPRMTSCAGICCYEGRGGLCSVRLSEPLLKLRPRKDLVQTLLHEMIHAYLFVTDNNKDHDGHGPEFHKHMYRINKMTGANITVYHTFHDEVKLYKKHWWRCNGPCQKRHPYFGYVKRANNRAPAPNDLWWAEHQRTCGGQFIKIKEPENYKKKGTASATGTVAKEKKRKAEGPDIRAFFNKKPQNAAATASNVHALSSTSNTSPGPSTKSPTKKSTVTVFGGIGHVLGKPESR